MNLHGCSREGELRELVERGRWPAAADPNLRVHVAACRSCGDLALVAEAFHDARAESTATARLVPPGVLWWRAQLRRRQAAAERITRSFLTAQITALALTLLPGVGFLAYQAMTSDTSRAWLLEIPQNALIAWRTLRASFAPDPLFT